MLARTPGALSRSWWWVGAGLFGIALVVVVDLVTSDAVLIGALILGPFVAAFGARTRDVVVLGILAVALAIALGWVDGIFGESDRTNSSFGGGRPALPVEVRP